MCRHILTSPKVCHQQLAREKPTHAAILAYKVEKQQLDIWSKVSQDRIYRLFWHMEDVVWKGKRKAWIYTAKQKSYSRPSLKLLLSQV